MLNGECASHSRALGHIQLDRYTREQVSRLAASTLSRCLSTGSEIETQAEMDRKLHNCMQTSSVRMVHFTT